MVFYTVQYTGSPPALSGLSSHLAPLLGTSEKQEKKTVDFPVSHLVVLLVISVQYFVQ